jgi:hypothetical protein
MINSIRNSLNAILGGFTALNNAAGAGRIFELYIMTGIATEMQNRGFELWLQRPDGTRINPGDANRTFIQRGGAPSDVPSAFDGPNNASVIGMRRSQITIHGNFGTGYNSRGEAVLTTKSTSLWFQLLSEQLSELARRVAPRSVGLA